MSRKTLRIVISSVVVLACLPLVAQTQASCTFTIFQIPQLDGTEPAGINRYGNVVGAAFFLQGIRPQEQIHRGFIRYADGATKVLNAPNAVETFFSKRNANGITVGSFERLSGGLRGVVFFKGVWTNVDFPNASSTDLAGINLYGTIVGHWVDTTGFLRSFKLKNKQFTGISFPGARRTDVQSISDTGVIVGSYISTAGFEHGFVLINGVYRTFDNPLSKGATELRDINAKGTIVGNRFTAPNGETQGFMFKNGAFKDIVVPGADSTSAQGVNGFNVVTGVARFAGVDKGYIAHCQ